MRFILTRLALIYLIVVIGIIACIGIGQGRNASLLSYVGDLGGQSDIFLYDLERDQTVLLTNDTHNEAVPRWSPDGQQLAYIRQDDSQLDVHIRAWDGQGDHIIGDRLRVRPNALLWSLDGRYLIVRAVRDGQDALYVTDLQTGVGTFLYFEYGQYLDMPVWSPDGRYLAFGAELEGSNATSEDIVMIDFDNREVSLFNQQASIEKDPAWSADGNWLAFISDRGGIQALFVSDGTQNYPLYAGTERAMMPIWSPTDSVIAFVSSGADGNHVHLMTVHTLEHVSERVIWETDSRILGLYWSSDGRYLAIHLAEQHQLLLYQIATQEVVRVLAHIHDPAWLSSR